MTPEEIAGLRAAAVAATPGPWFWQDTPEFLASVYTDRRTTYLTIAGECWFVDARYIALANPQTILAQLDDLADLRERNAKLVAALQTLVYGWAAGPSNTDAPEEIGRWDYEFNGALANARTLLASTLSGEA